jgi:hypothetical protein
MPCITFIFWVEDYNAQGNKAQQTEQQRTQSGAVGIQEEMLTFYRARDSVLGTARKQKYR